MSVRHHRSHHGPRCRPSRELVHATRLPSIGCPRPSTSLAPLTRPVSVTRCAPSTTNQQRSASTQVATAVREVAGASEEVAKGAKRVTSLSNELAALAHDLQKVIVTFETHHAGTGRFMSQSAAGAKAGDGGDEGTYDLEALRRG